MIKTFKHRGLQRLFETGSKAGIQPAHAPKLSRQLRQLNDASGPEDMDLPGWNLHPLKGQNLNGHWSVWVNGNWRLTFTFDGQDATLVDYQDYH
ncbi:MAG: hypothetical protein EPN31_05260 [Castellaniella sp.]|uniref:type II toxin-antitoxin system RelE/ParE family toxin n=1 Tax=Castellaniella sp. TaxID=1955812 RepID=UPI0012296481|nr:type II toxin-antitoxin system RelE/ParE family toxin [Castellaniella sp.]TAN29886.1 MAG: hypothetical protein EPN31_05260 [Castellaniella sp.]